MSFVRDLLELARTHQCVSADDHASYLASLDPYSRPFVISMLKDAKRYERVHELLTSMGLEPIRFNAITGSAVRGHRVLKGFDRLKDGELGCLASHLCILALASTHPSSEQFTLIFEDDVTSSLRGDALLENLARASEVADREGASLLHLGKCFETCGQMTHVEGNIYRSYKPYCAHAIAVRNGVAEGYTLFMRKKGAAVDNLYMYRMLSGEVRGLAFHPALFYQDVLRTSSNIRPGMINSYNECIDTRDCETCQEPQPCPSPSPPACPTPDPARDVLVTKQRTQHDAGVALTVVLLAIAIAVAVCLEARSRRRQAARRRRLF
jgi:hypothetical protein